MRAETSAAASATGTANSASSTSTGRMSERFHDDEHHDTDQDQHRRLIEPAIPHVPVRIAAVSKSREEPSAPQVIHDQQRDERELGVQPPAGYAEAEPQRKPRQHREHR